MLTESPFSNTRLPSLGINPQQPPPNFKFFKAGELFILLLVSIISILLIIGLQTVKYKSPSPSTENPPIKKDTFELVTLAQQYEKSSGQTKKDLGAKITKVAAVRKKEVLSLISENKISEALSMSIPDSYRQPIQDLAPNDLEQSFDKQGTLSQIHVERPNKAPELINSLQTKDKVYTLKFVNEPNQSGSTISVQGFKWDNTVLVNSFKTSNVQGVSVSTGPQKLAIILIRWQDQPPGDFPSGSRADIERHVAFMKNFYSTSSNGQIDVQADVYGWYTIPLNIGNSCDDAATLEAQRQDVINASTADIDFTQYNHVHFFANCDRAFGFGTVPPDGRLFNDSTGSKFASWGVNSSTDGAYLTSNGANFGDFGITHEIGHQIGAHHSNDWDCGSAVYSDTGCTTHEYFDRYSVMADSTFDTDANHKQQYGWLNSTNLQTLTSSSPFKLCPYETAGCINVLRVPKLKDASNNVLSWYYVEWRQALGLDATIPAAAQNGALIHFTQPGDLHSYLIDSTPDSTSTNPGDMADYYDAAFKPGTTFSDPTDGVSISIDAVDASGLSGTVTLTGSPSGCTKQAPVVAISPVSQSTTAGTKLTYALTVTNKDIACTTPSVFNLQASIPPGWTAAFPATSISVNPGSFAAVNFDVTSSPSSANNNYKITVAATNSTDSRYTSSADAYYVIFPAGSKSQATGLTATVQSCGPDPSNGNQIRMTVHFAWTPASNYQPGNIPPVSQYLDWATNPSPSSGQDVTGKSTLDLYGFLPNTDYWWRINTDWGAFLGGWAPSTTGSFNLKCPIVSPTPTPSPTPPPSNSAKATGLTATVQGCGPQGKVTVKFTWTPATNYQPGNIPPLSQWLDWALVSDLNNVPSGYGGNRDVTGQATTTYTDFFAPNTDYWWRINTDWGAFLGGWAPSTTGSFNFNCAVVPPTPTPTPTPPPRAHSCQNTSGAYNLGVSVSVNTVQFTTYPIPNVGQQVVIHVIHDPDTGSAAWDSPFVGSSPINWNGAPNGSYCATMTWTIAAISNTVSFTVGPETPPPTPTPTPNPTPIPTPTPPPVGGPAPDACKNAIQTNNLTDYYITDKNGNPAGIMDASNTANTVTTFNITGSGSPGSTVTATGDKTLSFTLDMSKLQAIFGGTNSNYLEGQYQSQDHQQSPLLNLSTENRDNFFGPGQKAGPKVMTDQMKVKYVNYVYNKPTLAESANTFSDVSGKNPMTVYQMVQHWGLPQPPSNDSPQWQLTWGLYWEKIPTAYSEFYEGKLEFRAAVGNDTITKVKNGELCPVTFASRPPITFIMPDLFRATATSGQVNQLIVPKIAQSPENNLILASTQEVKNALATIVNRCVYLASQNPISKKLKKIISYLHLEQINPIKSAYAATNSGCIKILGDGKSGTAPYCAIPAGQLPAEACSPSLGDPNQLDKGNTNVVCKITFTFSKTMTLPASGNGEWDNCTYSGGNVSCSSTVAVWPDFRIPWIGEIWNNTLYSDSAENIQSLQQTGRPGVYSFFTPDLVLKSAKQQDPLAAYLQGLVDQCNANPPVTSDPGNLRGCGPLANWATTGGHSTQYSGLADCVVNFMITNQPQMITCLKLMTISIIGSLQKMPGQVGNTLGDSTSNVLGVSTGEGKQPLIGATDCLKMFVRDMALKPLVLQHYLNIDTSCIPKPQITSTPAPTPNPTPLPPGATPTPTPVPTPIPTPTPGTTPTPRPTSVPTPTPTPRPTPTPTPTPVPSLTFSWSRDTGFAAFVDANAKTSNCSSTGLSCSTPTFTFWPGSSLIYAVHVSSGSGPIFKSGGTTAAANGSASMSWDWTYVALVYPNSFANCSTAGSECKIQTINNNSQTVSATFNNLNPATSYRETVCTPDCGTGMIIFSRTDSTP